MPHLIHNLSIGIIYYHLTKNEPYPIPERYRSAAVNITFEQGSVTFWETYTHTHRHSGTKTTRRRKICISKRCLWSLSRCVYRYANGACRYYAPGGIEFIVLAVFVYLFLRCVGSVRTFTICSIHHIKGNWIGLVCNTKVIKSSPYPKWRCDLHISPRSRCYPIMVGCCCCCCWCWWWNNSECLPFACLHWLFT